MDTQDFRSLQEAYLDVYQEQQLDEELTGARAKRAEKKGFKQLARGQEGSRLTISGNLPTKRGGGGKKGEPKVGMRSSTADDQGSSNKSKRRRGKKVADTRGEEDFDYQYSKQYDEQVDIYDIILSHLLDEGYAETPEAAEVIMVNMSEEWRGDIMERMTMKDFKANRRKIKRREASADAKKRGHVGKEWYNSGRTYSPDEAKSGRANMPDHERSTRHRSALDPEGDDSNYSADKTKNPKKLRKQKAMGEH